MGKVIIIGYAVEKIEIGDYVVMELGNSRTHARKATHEDIVNRMEREKETSHFGHVGLIGTPDEVV